MEVTKPAALVLLQWMLYDISLTLVALSLFLPVLLFVRAPRLA